MQPLAERIRPQSLSEYIGQNHLVGPNSILTQLIESGNIPSMILWGPPGTGKTTLARIIAHETQRPFQALSAISSGVKEVREAIERARKQHFFNRPGPLLFIDEIHRFNKGQQDALLGSVEDGTIVLIGATTENPSFEVVSALLSRCQVYVLRPLEKEDFILLIKRATADPHIAQLRTKVAEYDALIKYSSGDARRFLNLFEVVAESLGPQGVISDSYVEEKAQVLMNRYDKAGDQHYDMASAMIKSVRGSHPDAAVYWMARMIDGGEDIKFIARRLIISAAEDIGLANPNALLMANQCAQAIQFVGLPEARIILSETVIYLSTSPKSNTAYMAIDRALSRIKQTGPLPVPLHLRNAPTHLMKQMGFGEGYKYSHNYVGSQGNQLYLPEQLKEETFYHPGNNPSEARMKKFLDQFLPDNQNQ